MNKFFNEKSQILCWDEVELQIASFLFNVEVTFDENILYYDKKEDRVKCRGELSDEIDDLDWSEFYEENKKEIDRLLKQNPNLLERGVMGVKVNNIDEVKDFAKKVDKKVRIPKEFVVPFYFYYNLEKEIFDWCLHDQFYGPWIEEKEI